MSVRVQDWWHHVAVVRPEAGGDPRAVPASRSVECGAVQRYAVFERSDLDALVLETVGRGHRPHRRLVARRGRASDRPDRPDLPDRVGEIGSRAGSPRWREFRPRAGQRRRAMRSGWTGCVSAGVA